MVEFKVKFDETEVGFDTEFSTENDNFDVEFDNTDVVAVVISDHAQLINRDAPDQHTIESIAGLEDELGGKLESVPALTNQEIENMLKGFV